MKEIYIDVIIKNHGKIIKGGLIMNTPTIEPLGITCWGCLACAVCSGFALTLVSALSGLNVTD